MKLKTTLLSLLACASFVHAGDLKELKVYPNTLVHSNGVENRNTWTNNTGNPVYIKRIQTYIGNAGGFDGTLVIWAMRHSDSTILQYLGWSDCANMGGPESGVYKDSFDPDYVLVQPGDSLDFDATGYPQASYNDVVLVTIFIWYTTTQP